MRTARSDSSSSGRGRSDRSRRSNRANHLPLKFEIPSDFDHGRQVQRKIMRRIESCGFDSESTFALKLALEEAMMNAIKHGNQLDPRKKVHIEANVTPKRAEITIEDEGPGFKRCDIPDPTTDENVCKCSGRGIFLIERYMNQVRWTRGGRRVKMVKRNEAKRET